MAKYIIRAAATILTTVVCWIGWNQANHNFGITRPGHLFRSCQMPGLGARDDARTGSGRCSTSGAESLGGMVPAGSRRDPWRPARRQDDIPLSSCVWMSRLQAPHHPPECSIAAVPAAGPLSLGIGADRVTAAITELLRGEHAGRRPCSARTPLYIRLGDGEIMSEFIDQYASAGFPGSGLGAARRSSAGGPRGRYVRAGQTGRSGPTIRLPWSTITRPATRTSRSPRASSGATSAGPMRFHLPRR